MRVVNQKDPNIIYRIWNIVWDWLRYLISASALLEICQKNKKLEVLPNRTGEVVVITGASQGIGYETLKKLLECDFSVIIGVRNVKATTETVKRIREESLIKTGQTKIIELDLKSLNSVRKFAEKVLEESGRIDLIINNAGIMFGPYETTKDGFESRFQVNYLSHFLLTYLLLPKMKETSKTKESSCRIVNVSSKANFSSTKIDIDQIEIGEPEKTNTAYCNSKLAQILHTNYLDKMFQSEGVNIRANSTHPGMVPSNLWNNMFGPIREILLLVKPFYRNLEDGANVSIYAALAPELEKEGGFYIENCSKVTPNKIALDEVLQNQLWNKSLDILGINFVIKMPLETLSQLRLRSIEKPKLNLRSID